MQSVIQRNQNHLLVQEILAGEEVGGSLEEQTTMDEDHNGQVPCVVRLKAEKVRPASAKTATTVVG